MLAIDEGSCFVHEPVLLSTKALMCHKQVRLLQLQFLKLEKTRGGEEDVWELNIYTRLSWIESNLNLTKESVESVH